MQLPDLVVIAEARTRSCVNALPYPVAMPVQMLTLCLPIGWS
jgi:hypothetical protein